MSAERRRTVREPTIGNAVRLHWYDGDRDHEVEGSLLNVSLGGALLRAEPPPPLGKQVWLRMAAPVSTDWIAAEVVRHEGGNRAGIAYTEDGRRDLLLAATVGVDLFGVLFRDRLH